MLVGLEVYKEKGGYEMRSKIAKKLLATSVLTAMTIGLVGCGEEAGVENQEKYLNWPMTDEEFGYFLDRMAGVESCH